MSEIGLSLHFWRARHDDTCQFVIAQGATGRIVASNENWTCFVPFDPEDEPRLLAEWRGTVLKWSYAEDYGLGLDFHRGGRVLGQVSFIWGAVLTGQPPGGLFASELRSELVSSGVLSRKMAEEVEDVVAGSISGSIVRDRLAAILGLAAFEWLSPEACLQEGVERTREEYPDAEDDIRREDKRVLGRSGRDLQSMMSSSARERTESKVSSGPEARDG